MITPEQLARSGSEEGHQKALFCWIASSGIDDLQWCYHIPNGEQRDAITGAKLKAMGVRSGYPDIGLDLARGKYHGLRIELKRVFASGAKPSLAQVKWIDRLRSVGYFIDVAYGWEDARFKLLNYLEL